MQGGISIDCERVHRTLKRIVKARASLDAQEAAALREAKRLRVWREYGYASMVQYMEAEMGVHGAGRDGAAARRERDRRSAGDRRPARPGRAVAVGRRGTDASGDAGDRGRLAGGVSRQARARDRGDGRRAPQG